MKTLDDTEEYELWGYPDTTVVDCNFLEKAFEAYGCNVNAVLDIACGTGRHAIEMAERGYAVTGLDISESMISKAKEKAGSLEIEFVEEDMLNLRRENRYDAAYILFNTVSLITENDEIITLMKAVHKALKKDGLFLIELGNLWGLMADNSFHNSISCNVQERKGYKRKYTSKAVIGPNNGVYTQTRDTQYWKDDETLEPKRQVVKQRVYSINEFELLAQFTGYALLAVYGSLDVNKKNPEPFKRIDDPNRVYETMDHYKNFTLVFQRLKNCIS